MKSPWWYFLVIGALIAGSQLLAACGDGGEEEVPEQAMATPTAMAEATETAQPALTPTAEAVATETSEELACADGSTQQFREVSADAPWSVYCPTFLPDGYELDDIVYGLDIAGAAPEGGMGAVQAQFVNPETGDSITFIQGLPGLSALTSGIRGGEALAETPYGDFQAELFESAPEAPGTPFLAVLGSSDDITHWIEAIGPSQDETRQVAAGMRLVEALP